MNFYIHTLGCKVNQYESEKISRALEKGGFMPAKTAETADIIIINSCTVTAESDRKTRQLVRRFRRGSPGAAVVLTGCMPQAFPEKAAALPADIIVGNGSDRDILKSVQNYLQHQTRVIDIKPHKKGEAFEAGEVDRFEGRTRAYMKIEDGCNRGCTYCIIPKARGRVRSRSLESIRKEAERLAQNGFCELVLVGINLSSYGQDLTLSLADAVDAAAAPQGIRRVRLGSLEPDLTTTALLDRLRQNPKFCPQFHLALQSGCSKTLKRMNRLYSAEDYLQTVTEIRARFKNAAITTDIMVGFCGETEQEFKQSLAFCQSLNLLKAHVFPYSVRTGTAAAGFEGQVPEPVKAERAKRMANACSQSAKAFLQTQIGTVQQVLVETKLQNGLYTGHSPNFTPVFFKGEPGLLHQIVPVKLTGLFNDGMSGEPAD